MILWYHRACSAAKTGAHAAQEATWWAEARPRKCPTLTPRQRDERLTATAGWALGARDAYAMAAIWALMWFLSPDPYGPILEPRK